MSSSLSQQKKQCHERLCIDNDTLTVRFPGGATRQYCPTHLPPVVNLTGAEVVDDA